VVSYGLWQDRLHGDAHVLGSKILLDRKPYVVIGVMARDFEFPLVPGHLNNSELWVPMSFTQQELTTGAASWNFNMVGRLKPGITPAQAQSRTGPSTGTYAVSGLNRTDVSSGKRFFEIIREWLRPGRIPREWPRGNRLQLSRILFNQWTISAGLPV
jgi:hypothetical protein